ncbi:MAG: helix-turn-helix domain-containing protein [Thermoplasmata archaeon]
MMDNTNGINNQQLAILETLSTQSKTIGQIARDVGMSDGRTSQLVKRLQEDGFLHKRRSGTSKRTSFSDRLFAEYLRGVILRNGIDLSDMFRYPYFDILLTLKDRELDKESLADGTDASLYQVKKYVLQLERKGILRTSDGKVKISRTLPELNRFLKAYSSYSNLKRLRGMTSKGAMVWENGLEFIFFAPIDEGISGAEPTGISAMSRYGIDIISDRVYYHYFKNGKELRVEDIAIDAILAANLQPRGILYTLLFLRKIENFDREYLISRGVEIGHEKIARDLVNFLRGGDPKSRGFPSRGEFAQICARYGVNPSNEDSSLQMTSSRNSSE